jgi:hypothetical protein
MKTDLEAVVKPLRKETETAPRMARAITVSIKVIPDSR